MIFSSFTNILSAFTGQFKVGVSIIEIREKAEENESNKSRINKMFVHAIRRFVIYVRSLSQVAALEQSRTAVTAGEQPHIPRSAVVIGGGIIGISSALQLARRGVAVTVLEENKGG